VFELLLLLALVVLGGVLAGTEMAIITARRGRLEEAAGGGSTRARAALHLRKNPERFLATVQVGITLVGAFAGAYGGKELAEKHVEPWLAGVGFGADAAGTISLALVVALLTYLQVVFGELVPKSLALRYADRYALAVARPMLLLGWLGRPLIWLFATSSNLVLRLFGDRTNFVEGKLTREDLEHVVEEASTAGSIDVSTGRLVARALDFAQLRVADVMVPRRFVQSVPEDADEATLRAAMLGKGHRRVPVHRGSIDQISGYVLREDVLACLWDGKPLDVAALRREPFFLPETMPADRALRELQDRRLHLAIVVEEHGGTAGLITLEDLVEELVGEIFHEHDALPAQPIVREGTGTARVLGSVTLRDVWHELKIDLPERGDARTVGGLAVALAGERVPVAGERFAVAPGLELEVVEASVRRVRVVRLHVASGVGPAASA
jgi:putative hemolysin